MKVKLELSRGMMERSNLATHFFQEGKIKKLNADSKSGMTRKKKSGLKTESDNVS